MKMKIALQLFLAVYHVVKNDDEVHCGGNNKYPRLAAIHTMQILWSPRTINVNNTVTTHQCQPENSKIQDNVWIQ